jgi:P27 family predicted phage terminase small subunit
MIQKPPKHLRPATRKWWKTVVEQWELSAHHIRVLTLAAESWDRHLEAREALEKTGMTYVNRFGEPKPHPAVEIESTNRIHFARLMRELCLDDGTEPPETRMPRAGRND